MEYDKVNDIPQFSTSLIGHDKVFMLYFTSNMNQETIRFECLEIEPETIFC